VVVVVEMMRALLLLSLVVLVLPHGSPSFHEFRRCRSAKELKRAFRRHAMQLHPDRVEGSAAAAAAAIAAASDEEGDDGDDGDVDIDILPPPGSHTTSSSSSSPAASSEDFIALRAAYEQRLRELSGGGSTPGGGAGGSPPAPVGGDFTTLARRSCPATTMRTDAAGAAGWGAWTFHASAAPSPTYGPATADVNVSLGESMGGARRPWTASRRVRCPTCEGVGLFFAAAAGADQGAHANTHHQHAHVHAGESGDLACAVCKGTGLTEHAWVKGGPRRRTVAEEGRGEGEGAEAGATPPPRAEWGYNVGRRRQRQRQRHAGAASAGGGGAASPEEEEEEDEDGPHPLRGRAEVLHRTCVACCGTGKKVRARCNKCGGEGTVLHTFNGTLRVPPGVSAGDLLPLNDFFAPDDRDEAASPALAPAASDGQKWYPMFARVTQPTPTPPVYTLIYPHLERQITLSLTHFCSLRSLRLHLPSGRVHELSLGGDGEAVEKKCCTYTAAAAAGTGTGGTPSPIQRFVLPGVGLPVLAGKAVATSVPGYEFSVPTVGRLVDAEGREVDAAAAADAAARGDAEAGGAYTKQEVGHLLLTLRLRFPERVGAAQREAFEGCFGPASMGVIGPNAELLADLLADRVWDDEEGEGGLGAGAGGWGGVGWRRCGAHDPLVTLVR
jgi:DnaJ-class molecular chaperone